MATAIDNSATTSQPSKIPAEELAAMDGRVRAAQIKALYRHGRISNLFSPVIAAIVGYIILSEVKGSLILAWLALVLVASIARGIVHHRFERIELANTPVSNSTKWAFLLSICISGLVWGGGMLFLFPENNLALQAFLIVAILGMGAGAAASFGPFFPALAVYVVPLILPITATLLLQQTVIHIAFGVFGIIFLVVLLLLGLTGHRNFAASVILEFENAFLSRGLEHAQRRLEDAIDSMSEAFALFDTDDRLVLANERLRQLVPQLTEPANTDIAYHKFMKLFANAGMRGAPLEQVQRWTETMIGRHRVPGEAIEVELADGQWLRVSEQLTSDGCVVTIFTDLTTLKNREAALGQSEQRFRDFTEAASDWVFELDADLRFISVSGRHAEVTGYGPDFLIGKKQSDYPSLNQDADWRAIATALAERRPFHNRRISRPDANGEPFHFLSSGIPVFSEDGTFLGFRGTGSDITAIVRAEALAREAQKQLFDAIESIPAGFILFDKDGCLSLWNSRAPEFLSSDRDLIRTGTRYADLLLSSAASGNVIEANEDKDAWFADRMRWFDEPEIAREARFADGRFVQILGRRTADGGVVAIFTDITEIRRDQQELAEKTTLLQATLEGMGEGILVLDQSRRVTLVNDQFQQLLGLSPTVTAIGTSIAEITNKLTRDGGVALAHDLGEDRQTIDDLFDAGNAFQIEHRRPTGIRLLVRANPLPDAGWVLLLTDVTVERSAVAALEESEERYRQLVENSPDLISIHKAGRFIFVNPTGARLVGASSPDALIGRRVLEFVHVDHHADLRISQPTGGVAGATYEFRALRDDGTEFEAEGVSLEFTYLGGPAILNIVRDITLRKLAQTQLVQMSKLATLGEMAAGITHELNQPLNVIRMAADSSLILMENDKTDREFERKQFERISAHAVRLADIVSHMATFSRREDDDSGHELLDPLESVTAAVSMVRDQYSRDDVYIDLELPDKSCLLYGNPVRLEQVILNLLTNARDALVLEKVDPQSGRPFKATTLGRIQVSAWYEADDAGDAGSPQRIIAIRIEDNGGGISADALGRVFDPFFTTKRTGQGTGLGLAIGYSIVDSMGGRIVASNGSKGAVFEVRLPIANDLESAESVAQATPTGNTAKTRWLD